MHRGSMSHLISQDIKQNVLLSSYLDSWLHQLTGEKRGEDENTKIWISQERKELFRWKKKTVFIDFEGLSFVEK